MVDVAVVRDVIEQVDDPEILIGMGELGMVRDVGFQDGAVDVTIALLLPILSRSTTRSRWTRRVMRWNRLR